MRTCMLTCQCIHDEHIIDGRKGGMLSSGCCLYAACGYCRLRAVEMPASTAGGLSPSVTGLPAPYSAGTLVRYRKFRTLDE